MISLSPRDIDRIKHENEIKKLRKENELMREVLKWYANEEIYLHRISGYSNASGKAREVLKELGK